MITKLGTLVTEKDDPFGFGDIDTTPAPTVDSQVAELIMPLLYNLRRNPNNPTIKWPNRADAINKLIQDISAITGKQYIELTTRGN